MAVPVAVTEEFGTRQAVRQVTSIFSGPFKVLWDYKISKPPQRCNDMES